MKTISLTIITLILFLAISTIALAQGPSGEICDGGQIKWEQTESIKTARVGISVASDGNHIYAIGGSTSGKTSDITNTVEVADRNEDGTVSNWRNAEPISYLRWYAASVISGTYIYVIGGYGPAGGKIVEYGAISPDGSISGWNRANDTVYNNTGAIAFIQDNYLYITNGFDTYLPNQRALIAPDGSIGLWETTTAEHKNYIKADDWYYRINSGGSGLGYGPLERSTDGLTWQAISKMSSYREKSTLGYGGNYLYLIGGLITDTTISLAEYWDIRRPPWPGDKGLSINYGDLFTNQITTTLTIGDNSPWGNQIEISNDGGFYGATWEPYSPCRQWTITQYGVSILPRTVYVRFKNAQGQLSSTFSDDIILDITAPDPGQATLTDGAQTASTAAVPPAGLHLQVAQAADAGQVQERANRFVYLPLITAWQPPANVTLHLSATDDVSGVGMMQISTDSNFAGASWEPYRTVKPVYLPAGQSTVWVRFRDWAGNVSRPISAKR